MPPQTSPSPQPTRTRGLLEILLLSAILYIFLGAPGLSSLSSFSPLSSPSSSSGSGSGSSSSNDRLTHHDASGGQSREKLNSIVYPTPNLQCPPHGYRTHVLSASPLVLYLEDFLSPTEVHELVQLSNPSYQPSTLFTSSRESHDPTIRLSEKSLLPRSNTVRCIEARALALQGWPQDTFIERLWTQRYNVSGHYKLHYDWGAASPKARRASSFMVYLSGGRDEGEAGEEKLEGGGTHFPRLRHPSPSLAEGEGASQERREWCDFISCPASSSSSPSSASASDSNDGVTFLPVAGNAVFWQNFDTAGRGHKETLHAGLPVTKGQKIGLNIWSWYQAGHRAPEEGEDDADEGGGNAYGVGTNENDKEEL